MERANRVSEVSQASEENEREKGTGMNAEQANALAEYVNQNDRNYRASVLQLPAHCFDLPASGNRNKQANYSFVLLSNRNTGGNPPLIGGLHDYAEALRQQQKNEEALRRFEEWQQELKLRS